MNIGRSLRTIAAIALIISGLVHLQLYFQGYRAIDKVGPSLMLNAVASGVIAAGLLARKDLIIKLAGVGLALATLGAFVISRQGNGLFDFREHGLNPSPQAVITLVAEIVTVIALAVSLLPAVRDDPPLPSIGLTAAAAAATAAVFVGLGVYWSNHYAHTTLARDDSGSGVQISNFAFGPNSLDVPTGTTVTWTNADGVAHTVVSTDLTFRSDSLDQGSTFDFTFDTPGEFAYVCGIHPQMSGTITVTG